MDLLRLLLVCLLVQSSHSLASTVDLTVVGARSGKSYAVKLLGALSEDRGSTTERRQRVRIIMLVKLETPYRDALGNEQQWLPFYRSSGNNTKEPGYEHNINPFFGITRKRGRLSSKLGAHMRSEYAKIDVLNNKMTELQSSWSAKDGEAADLLVELAQELWIGGFSTSSFLMKCSSIQHDLLQLVIEEFEQRSLSPSKTMLWGGKDNIVKLISMKEALVSLAKRFELKSVGETCQDATCEIFDKVIYNFNYTDPDAGKSSGGVAKEEKWIRGEIARVKENSGGEKKYVIEYRVKSISGSWNETSEPVPGGQVRRVVPPRSCNDYFYDISNDLKLSFRIPLLKIEPKYGSPTPKFIDVDVITDFGNSDSMQEIRLQVYQSSAAVNADIGTNNPFGVKINHAISQPSKLENYYRVISAHENNQLWNSILGGGADEFGWDANLGIKYMMEDAMGLPSLPELMLFVHGAKQNRANVASGGGGGGSKN